MKNDNISTQVLAVDLDGEKKTCQSYEEAKDFFRNKRYNRMKNYKRN